MSDIRNVGNSTKARRGRIIKLAPMTRAVRSALATSAMVLALGASGGAFAAGHQAPQTHALRIDHAALDFAPVHDLTVAGTGSTIEVPEDLYPTAISEYGLGDVVIDNGDPQSSGDTKYNVAAISGYSVYGNVDITNHAGGDLYAGSVFGNAIGIYGYSIYGDVSIDNAGSIYANSYLSVADGIFASGANVDVTNSGEIATESQYGWTAGIEAQGADSVEVDNSGYIAATAGGFLQVVDYYGDTVGYSTGGTAIGIYATGGEAGAVVGNSGDIVVDGYTATGIQVQSYGDASLTNSGDIAAGSGLGAYYDSVTGYTYYYGTAVATGLDVSSNGEGAAVEVDNSGDIVADGIFGGTGIQATASGLGGTVDVTNTGDIYASQDNGSGYGAFGIIASADGNSSIHNGGDVIAYSAGAAMGLSALSFAGNASVTNSGDILAVSNSTKYYGAYGIVAFAGYGEAEVDNSGSVVAYNTGILAAPARAIDAQGLYGASVTNSGSLYANGKYAYGVFASSGQGDVAVTNTGDGSIGFYSYLGYGTGVIGLSTNGNVGIDNAGDIEGYGYKQAVGAFGRSAYGDVSIDNGGDISVTSGSGTAAGVFARADYGTASVTNTGDITASDTPGTGFYGYSAYGILARGNYAEVANSGNIVADGYYYATGIAASSYYGTTVTNTGGSISAIAVGGGTGISASSLFGDTSVDNASDIEAVGIVFGARGIQATSVLGNVDLDNSGDVYAGSLYGDSIGLYAYSTYGDASVGNSGDITAISYYGLADGIFASGANVEVTNSGAIQTYGYTWTAGIEAQGADSVTVTNSGDISATAAGLYQVYAYSFYDYTGGTVANAPGAQAFGLYATGGEGGATVGNSGNIEVLGGYATGIEVQSSGDASVTNSGDIVAGNGLQMAYYYYAGTQTAYYIYSGTQLANGIDVGSNGEGAAVSVSNSGDITADGIFGADGIVATASGYGGTVTVANSGNIYASQNQKYGYGATGITASGDSDTSVGNSGMIDVYSGGVASGIQALSFAGDASVTNSGDISVENSAQLYYAATGIVSFAGYGDAHVTNSGSVDATSKYWATGIDARGFGDTTVQNSGSVYANGSKYAFGVYATAGTGDLTVTNTAAGDIGFYSYLGRGWGVFGYANNGDVHITNAGGIEGYAYGQSAGIFAIAGQGDVSIGNGGDITVSSGSNVAVGAFARADYGTATVTNSGDIVASDFPGTGFYGYSAYGIFARGEYAQVGNSGSITAEGNFYGTGIQATSYYGTTVVTTGGDINAIALGGLVQHSYQGYYGGTYYYYVLAGAATGIDASTLYGDTHVSNASDINATALYVAATGINAVAGGDVVVSNSGDIAATSYYGYATGISASDIRYAGAGSVSVSNSGDISLYAPYHSFGKAVGISAYRNTGSVVVQNSGDIDIYAGGRSYGIEARAKYGDVHVTNTGDITMLSHTDAQIGIQASTGNFFYGGGDVSVVNSGDISVHSDYGFANGIGAVAGSVLYDPYGNVYVRNTGDIEVFGQYTAAGIQARATAGDTVILNSGDVDVGSAAVGYIYLPDQVVGIGALNFRGGDITIQNTGDVAVDAYAMSYGLYAKSRGDGTVTITNAGDVTAHSDLATENAIGPYGYYATPSIFARGVYAYGYDGNVVVNNTSTGHIDATGGDIALGVQTVGINGNTTVNNAGTIHAGGSGLAAAVALYSAHGANTLNNAGTGVIGASGDEGYTWAVYGSDAVETINNSGKINGAITLFGGNDAFNNNATGVWEVGTTHGTDFGAGNDTLTNAGTVHISAGGLVSFGDGNDTINNGNLIDLLGGISMGAGNDTINNGSLFRINNGTVTMGTGTNAFNNTNTIKVMGNAGSIDLGGGTLTNTGLIDFIDGAADDKLTIAGTLAGTGRINIDFNLLTSTADQLQINGSVASSAVQTVNVQFPGMPVTAHTSAVFARVTGTSVAGNFVAGQMIGYNEPANFLDLDYNITSTINTANTAADVFSVNVDVVGLNDRGTLAASVASGAASFLNTQVGTFRQRLGVNPYGDSGKVMSAFFRAYTGEGDVDPAHVAGNFGQGGNFAYDQSTWGREIGVNANLFGNFHAGVVLGNADSRQRLTGNGVGQNRLDGMTWGAYATWYVPGGFYVDLTGRWMAMDVRSISAAGTLDSRVHTKAYSLEAGYEWNVGGFNIVPQLQYTLGKVEDVRTFFGDRANFVSHGGDYNRGRLGVELNKTFNAGALRITPYGSINAVREFDGKSTYTVADNFYGSTSVKGTSTMAELGIGVQTGGWAFNLGANWTDGGAFDGVVGGQASIRFAW